MANYYIRVTGSDASAGTSPGAAWRTWNKALGATGIASGDTLYIGAGTYREVFTIAMVSAVAETMVIGDVTGQYTGDPGEVALSSFLTNDYTLPSNTAMITASGRDFLTFQDIVFYGGRNAIISAATATSTNWTLRRCAFIVSGAFNTNLITLTNTANTAYNWTLDSCLFRVPQGTCIQPAVIRPAGADFDINIQIKNCVVNGAGSFVTMSSSGANVFNNGGIDIQNCSLFGRWVILTTPANSSTTIPCTIYNSHIEGGGSTGIVANAVGQIIEDYNIIQAGTARSNVTAGVHSVSDGSYCNRFFNGSEYIQRGIIMPFGVPVQGSPYLGFGNQVGGPSVDILNHPRPNTSQFSLLDEGTATSGTANTLTNTNRSWGSDKYTGRTLYIAGGTGAGQTKIIDGHTSTVLTVNGNWNTTPDNTSQYQIWSGLVSSTGTATAGAASTLTDANAVWGTNMLQGFNLEITAGTGSGQTRTVSTNTATVLTVTAAWGVNPDNTSVYALYNDTSITTVTEGVGAYEAYSGSESSLKRGSRRFLLKSFDNQS